MYENEECQIKGIDAMQIFDSRGNPTLQVTITLNSNVKGTAMVPSGASTGMYEAVELRDKNYNEFNGKGVSKAVDNVNRKIAKELIGMNALNQRKIDETLIKLDGTVNKSRLGANAILGVSEANLKAAANYKNEPIYRYIGGINAKKIPIPMMNILNGGKHADNNVNFQEIMIVPIGANSFEERMQMSTEIYYVLREILKKENFVTSVGDEGGFAPNFEYNKEEKNKTPDETAIELVIKAIKEAGYKPQKEVFIALDIASSEMRNMAKKIEKEGYYFWKTDEYKTKQEMIEYIEKLIKKYPEIISIEDPLSEDDWKEWKELTKRIGNKVMLVGDDLFVTNYERLKYGIESKVANTILIKPNQIGTVTETLDTIKLAKENGYKVIISHRSGETEDTFIADLAVGINANGIKSGAPCRTERVCKYNRLLNIEKDINY